MDAARPLPLSISNHRNKPTAMYHKPGASGALQLAVQVSAQARCYLTNKFILAHTILSFVLLLAGEIFLV